MSMARPETGTEHYRAGARVFSAGDEAQCAYIVEAGRVRVESADGQTVIGSIGAGGLLGEMAMLDGAQRTASAIAEQDTVLACISRDQIESRLAVADPVLQTLIGVLMKRFRNTLDGVQGSGGMYQAVTSTPQETESGLDAGMQKGLQKVRLENELRLALQNGQLQVVYQPLQSLQTGHWAGFEALSRWRHPAQGWISPEAFIGLAEETGLIVSLGLHVFEQACQRLQEFQAVCDRGLARQSIEGKGGCVDLFMGINVSGRQLTEPGFLSEIKAIIDRHGVDPRRIKLEVTESLVIDYAAIRDWLQGCHALGFQVALDDFGTGYSGFQHLLELEFDTLKLDQAFVRSLFSNPRSMQMIKAMTAMAQALGLKLVAEGIETREHLEALTELGVDYGQGFVIARPMQAGQVLGLMEKG